MRARLTHGGHRLALIAGLLVATGAAPGGASAAAATYTIVAPGSRVLAVTRSTGLLGFLGHDHAVEGAALSASVACRPEAPVGERLVGEVVIDAAALEIDTPAGRQAARLGEGPSGDDLAKIRRTFHGPDGLDTARFPTIRLALGGADAGAAGDIAALARITGQPRPVYLGEPHSATSARSGTSGSD